MNTYILRRRTFTVLKWILAVIIFIIAVFPIYWMINVVFSPPGISVALNPRLYPSSLTSGIAKIKDIFVERGFLNAYKTSLIYALESMALGVFVSSLAAYEFALFDFPGKKFLFGFAMAALMLPKTVSLIPLYLLVANKLGWLNTFQGLILPNVADVFGLFMMIQFMQKLPKDLIDAAKVDGASHFHIYFRIVIPLSYNAIFTLGIILFNRAWGQLTWPMIICKEQNMFTVSRIVNWFNQPDTWVTADQIMAANLMSAVPPLLIFFFFSKYVMQGVAFTGLKE